MNNLIIPPSPNWYEPQIMACAPDKTLVYGSNATLVVLKPNDEDDQPAVIKLIPYAHCEKIHSVSINLGWNSVKKLAVSTGHDKLVKLWNMETFELSMCNKTYMSFESKLVGATFAGNDKVVSVSENGLILIWKLSANDSVVMKHFLGIRSHVTCLSPCPHISWIIAFGLKKGGVIVADMRGSGTVLHRLRETDKEIVYISWCPSPENVVNKYKSANNIKITLMNPDKSPDKVVDITENKGDVKEINENAGENQDNKNETLADSQDSDKNSECRVEEKSVLLNKIEMKNLWTNLKFPDDDEIPADTQPLDPLPVSDFLKDCLDLKSKISNLKNTDDEESKEENSETPVKSNKEQRKILVASRNHTHTKDDETPKDTSPLDSMPVSDFLKECLELESQISNLNSTEDDKVEEENLDTPVKSKKGEQKLFVVSKNNNEEDVPASNIENDLYDLSNKVLEKNKNESSENTSICLDLANISRKDDELVKKFENLTTEDIVQNNEEKSLETISECQISKSDSDQTDVKSINEFNKTMEALKQVLMKNEAQNKKPAQQQTEYLLASSTKDGIIYIWKALTDGRLQVKFSLPKKHKSQWRKEVWTPVHWISPKILLSASNEGELLRWDLDSKEKITHKVVHQDHKGKIFSITAPLCVYNKLENKLQDDEELGVWTVGQDRMLLFTKLNSKREVKFCYPTIGQFQRVFDTSPLDPNKMAIGTEDGTIKFWDLSRKHFQNISMPHSKLKMSAKITSIAWHPNQECILAFGTDEGRVGKLNSGCLSKGQTYWLHYFKNSIHQMEWGPLPNNAETFGIYVCSQGKVGIYKDDKLYEEPQIIVVDEKEFITQLHWKPDYTLFACGTKNGRVIMLNSKMEQLYCLYFQNRPIVEMKWHPLATASDTDLSPCHYWLAVTTSIDFKVVVYDLENYSSEKAAKMDKVVVAEFEGNLRLINCMGWSQHQSGLLVCAAEDGIAQVYNVITKELISTFVNNNCDPILACIWSPLEKDFIISSGKDSTIRIWNMREHPKLGIEDIIKLRSIRLSIISKNKTKKDKTENSEDDSKDKIKNFLPTIHSATLEDCKTLLSLKESSNQKLGDNKIMKFFGTQSDMDELLTYCVNKHNTKDKYALHDNISLWKGNIGECIKDAIIENRVTPWLINMAPAVSPKLWLEACEVYARFLEESNPADPIGAASYYLACNKTEQAIDCLCVHSLFKEALAIAKSRLTEDDPIVKYVINKWATSSVINGVYEISALCFIALDKYKDAAQVLFKRTDLATLKFAAELAQKAEDTEMYDAIMFRYNLFNKADTSQAESDNKTALSTNSNENFDSKSNASTIGTDETTNLPALETRAQVVLNEIQNSNNKETTTFNETQEEITDSLNTSVKVNEVLRDGVLETSSQDNNLNSHKEKILEEVDSIISEAIKKTNNEECPSDELDYSSDISID